MIKMPERFSMGDNKRFHYRRNPQPDYDWQIYTIGLNHCMACDTEEWAKLICRLLEDHFDNLESQSDYDFHK